MEDDEEEEQTLREALEDYAALIRWMYFDYMLNHYDANFTRFKRLYLGVTKDLMDRIHDKYCDHVEAQRNQMY